MLPMCHRIISLLGFVSVLACIFNAGTEVLRLIDIKLFQQISPQSANTDVFSNTLEPDSSTVTIITRLHKTTLLYHIVLHQKATPLYHRWHRSSFLQVYFPVHCSVTLHPLGHFRRHFKTHSTWRKVKQM